MRFHSLPFLTAALIGALLEPRFAFAQNPFEAEIEAYEAQDLVNPPPLGSVVVTGSSSIAKWTTIQTDLAPLDVIARGFGGSSTDDLDFFLDRIVLKYQPRAVVIYEGENDITVNGQTPTHVASEMTGILARISAALPSTRVYVISIKATPAHIQYWAGWESWANQLLAALCATDARYTYIDTASHLMDSNGTPIPSYFVDDGVHFTPLGYQVWTAAIRPVLLPQQLIPMPTDSVPPTTPTGLAAAAQSSSRIDINWNGASDSGSGLGGYRVFRNGTPIASTTSITYSDTGLSSNTLYTYTVTAFDRMSPNRNESTPSAPASATTLPTSPPMPTVSLQVNPSAIGIGGTTQLTWTSTNATSCTASGGWAGAKATSGTATSSTLSVSTIFTLMCTGAGGTASDSKTVTVGSLPPGTWGNNDIGAVGAVGSSTQTTNSDGTVSATVKGSGADIWDAVDAFQFDYQSLTGDGTITARVVSETNTDGWAKAGVMIRETLSTSSAHALVAVTSANGVAFQRRTSTGSQSLHTYGPAVAAPYWVRLTRSGNIFSAYASPDGTTWTLIGQTTISMAASVYIGLAVTAHNAGLINTAAFDHVLISSGGAPPAATVSLTATPTSVASGGTTQLSWTSANATSCTASGGWSGSQATSGSATSSAITTSTTFTLTCTGAGGSGSDSKTVTIIGAPTVSLGVSPASVASGGTTQLTWSSTNATSCTASGGWSGSKATSGSATSSALSVTTTFTLTCTGAGGSGSDSKTVTVGASAGSWSNQDIGAVGAVGSSTQTTNSDGTVSATVKGSGADIWDVSDAFQFDYQPLTGNGTITARVVSLYHTNDWAKAGVMIRETLSPSSTHALVAVTSANGVAFQRRETTGAQSVHTYGPAVAAPYWVRLTRSGTTFSAYSSADGTTWTLVGTDTISMAATVYIGLAVTSHSAGSLTNANFDQVLINSGGGPPAATVSLTATPTSVASGGTTQLSWTSANATSCTASGGWSGSQATSGSATSSAITTSTTFTLTCTGAGGSGSDSKTVTIIGAPTVSLGVSPASVASGGTTQLTWSSTNATSCTASGGWSGSKATSGSATSSALSVTTTFTLTCTGAGGSGSDSKTVTVGASAGSWSNQDIGAVGAVGSSTQTTNSDGTVSATVKGSGADIWDVSDAFQFDYQPLTGNGTITARVVSLYHTNDWAKAGVMIRETLSPSSTHALVAVTSANGVAFQRRETTGAQSVHTYGPAVAAPYWVRLTRSGTTFSAYSSADGTTWTLVGTDTISMAATVYIGLAVTSHSAGSLTNANFDHVALP